MTAWSQISLEPELQRRARQRASELGISLAEYVRSLVARDLTRRSDVSAIFGMGSSGGADVARDKDRMVGEAVVSNRKLRLHR